MVPKQFGAESGIDARYVKCTVEAADVRPHPEVSVKPLLPPEWPGALGADLRSGMYIKRRTTICRVRGTPADLT